MKWLVYILFLNVFSAYGTTVGGKISLDLGGGLSTDVGGLNTGTQGALETQDLGKKFWEAEKEDAKQKLEKAEKANPPDPEEIRKQKKRIADADKAMRGLDQQTPGIQSPKEQAAARQQWEDGIRTNANKALKEMGAPQLDPKSPLAEHFDSENNFLGVSAKDTNGNTVFIPKNGDMTQAHYQGPTTEAGGNLGYNMGPVSAGKPTIDPGMPNQPGGPGPKPLATEPTASAPSTSAPQTAQPQQQGGGGGGNEGGGGGGGAPPPAAAPPSSGGGDSGSNPKIEAKPYEAPKQEELAKLEIPKEEEGDDEFALIAKLLAEKNAKETKSESTSSTDFNHQIQLALAQINQSSASAQQAASKGGGGVGPIRTINSGDALPVGRVLTGHSSGASSGSGSGVVHAVYQEKKSNHELRMPIHYGSAMTLTYPKDSGPRNIVLPVYASFEGEPAIPQHLPAFMASSMERTTQRLGSTRSVRNRSVQVSRSSMKPVQASYRY